MTITSIKKIDVQKIRWMLKQMNEIVLSDEFSINWTIYALHMYTTMCQYHTFAMLFNTI